MLPTIAAHNQLANLDWFRLRDAPLLKPQTIGTKHYKLSIRRKRSRACINCRNLEGDFQRFALDHRNREIILGQKVGAVVADCEMRDVTLELRHELFLPQQPGQLFVDPAFSKRHDIGLPFQILFRRIRASILTTWSRKQLSGFNHFTQALLSRIRASEDVCKRIWIVPSGNHCKQADTIRFELLVRLMTRAPRHALGALSFKQQVVLLGYVFAIAELIDVEYFLEQV